MSLARIGLTIDNVRYWILNVLTSRSNQSIGGFDVRAAQANARARLIDEHIYAEARRLARGWSTAAHVQGKSLDART
jgi:hypothetical protein